MIFQQDDALPHFWTEVHANHVSWKMDWTCGTCFMASRCDMFWILMLIFPQCL